MVKSGFGMSQYVLVLACLVFFGIGSVFITLSSGHICLMVDVTTVSIEGFLIRHSNLDDWKMQLLNPYHLSSLISHCCWFSEIEELPIYCSTKYWWIGYYYTLYSIVRGVHLGIYIPANVKRRGEENVPKHSCRVNIFFSLMVQYFVCYSMI